MTGSPAFVDYDRSGAVGTITVDRPPLNLYDPRLEREMAAAWVAAGQDDDAAVIVLRTMGRHFCGGDDLDASPTSPSEHPDPVALWRSQSTVTKPSIVAVQGGCVGGGLRWVWPCDLIVAATDAFFRDPTVGLGLGGIHAHGHTWEFGPRLAKEMLFTGGRLSATRLYNAGLVNRLVAVEDLHRAAHDLAEEIARMPRMAVRKAKFAVDSALDIQGRHTVVSRFAEMLLYERTLVSRTDPT